MTIASGAMPTLAVGMVRNQLNVAFRRGFSYAAAGFNERTSVASRYPKLAELLQRKSLKRGHFILSSGRTSTYYIDGKLTSFDPEGATAIAEAILKEIEDLPIDAVGGMDMGATPIVGAVAAHGFHVGRPYPTFVVRKEVKAHGTMKEIEGPIPPAPAKVVIVDDVVTTGDSILKAIDAVQKAGYEVLLAISVLDRNAGATQAIATRGVPYRPLLTLPDIGITEESARSIDQRGATAGAQ